MELKRKITSTLLDWRNKDKGTSAIFIDGARRVGKSYVCEAFAKSEYKSYILIDFAHISKQVRDVFEEDRTDLDTFFLKISAIYRVTLHIRDSVIIFDEVQQYPPARELIKYLVADGRYDYIETGSLITLRQNNDDIVIPSEEEHVKMFPMDFEEFLWAIGDDATTQTLRAFFEKKTPLGQALHRRVLNDFRKYILVGGMPQAVCEFVQTANLEQVDRIKQRILSLYREDVAKFAKGYEARVFSIFDQIPSQLAKPEKKFTLASLSKNARSRTYEDAFVWLEEAMIVNTCFNAEDPSSVLSMSVDHTTRKCYMGDTGLLVSMTFRDKKYQDNVLYQAILLDKLNINEGMLAENIVAQMLRANGHELYFYSRSDSKDRSNTMEVDFLIPGGKRISPVEVKSGRYQKHASLDKFRKRFERHLETSYILYTKDIMEKDGIVHLPLYLAMFL